MKELTTKDFEKDDVFDFTADIEIWGGKSGIGVECEGAELENILPKINALLGKLDNGKEQVVKALVEDGMLELAEDWASSAEEDEDEEDCYIMEDDTKVKLPITEKDFAASLSVNGISVYYDPDSDSIEASLYLMCQPDYFACHCIDVCLDGELNIEVNGLAG